MNSLLYSIRGFKVGDPAFTFDYESKGFDRASWSDNPLIPYMAFLKSIHIDYNCTSTTAVENPKNQYAQCSYDENKGCLVWKVFNQNIKDVLYPNEVTVLQNNMVYNGDYYNSRSANFNLDLHILHNVKDFTPKECNYTITAGSNAAGTSHSSTANKIFNLGRNELNITVTLDNKYSFSTVEPLIVNVLE